VCEGLLDRICGYQQKKAVTAKILPVEDEGSMDGGRDAIPISLISGPMVSYWDLSLTDPNWEQ
jgi:hypothetical protein